MSIRTEASRAAATPGSAQVARTSGFHPEIQGLRAVAVLLVVVFHLWPNRLSGGFVGVDVFFVISGYLITAHIFREVDSTGSLSLRRFWARRIRRLLPASLLVLALSAVATAVFLPATLWSNTAKQIAASALYVENWVLAGDAVDYMAQDNVATVAQHYWSLSVEEQFYVAWPLLVLGLVLLARRMRWSARKSLIIGLSTIGGVSLLWSIVATAADQSQAYFVTPTRVWEFAVGALIALVAVPGLRGALTRHLLSAAGLAAIVVAGLIFNGESRFPGWIALLPVLGTAAVIVAGSTGTRLTPGWWLSTRPMTFLGDISYSIYLVHWPLIIVLPHVTGAELRTLDKLGILVGTIGLAWLSKVYVEDPMRTRPLLAAVPWRSFAFAGLGMAVVVAGSVVITSEVDRRAEVAAAEAEQLLEENAPCVGPRALDTPGACDSVAGTGELVPPPEVVVEQNSEPTYPDCQQSIGRSAVKTCTIGSTSADPERTVAIVGDSHAEHWLPTLDRLGQERDWRVITYVKASCPVTAARRVLPDEQTEDASDSCLTWGAEVRDRVAEDPEISYVFTSTFSSAYEFTEGPDTPLDDPRTDGFDAVWSEWSAAGKDVFAIKDVPPTDGGSVPNCLAEHPDDRLECATSSEAEAEPASGALQSESSADASADVMADAVGQADDPRVHLLDLTDRFCDEETCYPVVGDVIVYRDYSHLSRDYAEALAPYLGGRVDDLLGTPR